MSPEAGLHRREVDAQDALVGTLLEADAQSFGLLDELLGGGRTAQQAVHVGVEFQGDHGVETAHPHRRVEILAAVVHRQRLPGVVAGVGEDGFGQPHHLEVEPVAAVGVGEDTGRSQGQHHGVENHV